MGTLTFWRRASIGTVMLGWSAVFLYCATEIMLAMTHGRPVVWRLPIAAAIAFMTIIAAMAGHEARSWLGCIGGALAVAGVVFGLPALMVGLAAGETVFFLILGGALTGVVTLPVTIWETSTGDESG